MKSLTSNSILVMFNKRIEIGPATDVHNYMLYPDEKIPDSVSFMAKGNAIRIFFENLNPIVLGFEHWTNCANCLIFATLDFEQFWHKVTIIFLNYA